MQILNSSVNHVINNIKIKLGVLKIKITSTLIRIHLNNITYYIKVIKIKTKKRYIKFKIKAKNTFFIGLLKMQSFTGIDIAKILDNYFSAIFILIIFKFFIYVFLSHLIKFTFFINYILLFSFWLIAIYFQLINKFRYYYMHFLNNYLPFFVVNDQLESLGDQTLLELENEDKYKNIIHYGIIFLIYLRLKIEQELYLYYILNFIFLQLLLFHKFFIFLSFYKIIMFLTKLTLYIKDRNNLNLKNNLSYYNKELKIKRNAIKASYENSILLSYWIVRDTTTYFNWIQNMFFDDFSTYKEHLEIKIDEKFVYGINHKLIKNNTYKIEKTQKNSIIKNVGNIFKNKRLFSSSGIQNISNNVVRYNGRTDKIFFYRKRNYRYLFFK